MCSHAKEDSQVIIEIWLQSKKKINFANGDVFSSYLMRLEQTKFDMSSLNLTKSGPRPQVEDY